MQTKDCDWAKLITLHQCQSLPPFFPPVSIVSPMDVSPLHFLGSVESVGLIDEEPFTFLNRKTVLENGESVMLVICVGCSTISPLPGTCVYSSKISS